MRKLIAVLGVLGVFTMSNAEPVMATGTVSIEEMKNTIAKLIQDENLQSERIAYLTQRLAQLESQVAKLAEQTHEIAAKVASTNTTSTPHSTSTPRNINMLHHSHVRHNRVIRHGRHVSKPSKLKTEYCTKSCPISHLKKGNSYCVKAYGLNVRKGPGKKYKVINVLKEGTVVSAVAREGEWIKISNPPGWISASYLKECGHGRKER